MEPLREIIALKRHIKAEQERTEQEDQQRSEGNILDSGDDRGFAEPFTGTIPFDFSWMAQSCEKKPITGSLVAYQPFIPPLNYNLGELISKPAEPEDLKKWKSVNFLDKQ